MRMHKLELHRKLQDFVHRLKAKGALPAPRLVMDAVLQEAQPTFAQRRLRHRRHEELQAVQGLATMGAMPDLLRADCCALLDILQQVELLPRSREALSESSVCPITHERIESAVYCDGHYYEKAALLRWVSLHGTSPMTRARVDSSLYDCHRLAHGEHLWWDLNAQHDTHGLILPPMMVIGDDYHCIDYIPEYYSKAMPASERMRPVDTETGEVYSAVDDVLGMAPWHERGGLFSLPELSAWMYDSFRSQHWITVEYADYDPYLIMREQAMARYARKDRVLRQLRFRGNQLEVAEESYGPSLIC